MFTPLSVPDRDFALLAAGGGGENEIGCLLAGQASRRLLLIMAVLEASGRASPGQARALRDACSLLARVQRTHPDAARRALLAPVTGHWAAACLQEEPRSRFFSCIAASAALDSGVPFELSLPFEHDMVFLPGQGTFSFPGAPESAVARSGDSGLTISAGNTETLIPSPGAGPVPGWRPTRLLTAEASGLRFQVRLDDAGPFRTPPGLVPAAPLSAEGARRWREVTAQAWKILVHRHPEEATGLAAGITAFTPLRVPSESPDGSPDRVTVTSATSADALGAVLLVPPSSAEGLALTLLHEFQHAKLTALAHLIPLIAEDSPGSAVFFAPWRQDPRPLDALLQGTYAYLGVARYWAAKAEAEAAPDAAATAEDEFAYCVAAVRAALGQITSTAQLTPAGWRFLHGMTDAVWLLDERFGKPDSRRQAAGRLARDRAAWTARHAGRLGCGTVMR